METESLKVQKTSFREPQFNLPGRLGVVTEEERFTVAFAQAYRASATQLHRRSNRNEVAMVREIPVNGYGIADLLAVSWRILPPGDLVDVGAFVQAADPVSRAFECKLKEWRRAMSQAARYQFFADQAIVVLHCDVAHRAVPYLTTFRTIRVGLWSFCPETWRIRTYYTPRSRRPRSERHRLDAVKTLFSADPESLPVRKRD